ncbi:MAG: Lrp/AsnC family transcriptional regulator [Planctomycetaceae bacterium]|nr:Lrp/AsnC family transcriptional regulator [Planctomycetaceae bacterium]
MKDKHGIRKNILSLVEHNAKLTAEEIAMSLGIPEADIRDEITNLEKERVICGYGAFINWDRTDSEFLTALIEVKVSPSRGQGFNRIAERIYRFDEVKAVYLMSGGYDLAVILEGTSLKEISHFVTDKLAPLESVLSTATHFVLKKYKDHGVILNDRGENDERMIVSP